MYVQMYLGVGLCIALFMALFFVIWSLYIFCGDDIDKLLFLAFNSLYFVHFLLSFILFGYSDFYIFMYFFFCFLPCKALCVTLTYLLCRKTAIEIQSD